MSPVEGSERHPYYDLCKVASEAFVDVCYFHSLSSNVLLTLSKSSINLNGPMLQMLGSNSR